MEKENFKTFIFGILIAVGVSLFFYISIRLFSVFIMHDNENPKSVYQGVEDSSQGKDINDLLIEIQEESDYKLSSVKDEEVGEIILDNKEEMINDIIQGKEAVTEQTDWIGKEFLRDINSITDNVNKNFEQLSVSVIELKDKNQFQRLTSLKSLATKIDSQLELEYQIIPQLESLETKYTLSDQEKLLHTQLTEVNSLHIKIIETAVERFQNLNFDYNDILLWFQDAEKKYQESQKLFNSLKNE